MVFAIPRERKTYVGTTDTFYDQDPEEPYMSSCDRRYLIDAIHYMFPEVQISEKDIESSWAGVRPLIYEEGKNASEISRKDEIWESKSGLVTIAGGKLTGYRKMAETVVDLLASKFKLEENKHFPKGQTKKQCISGGDFGGSANFNAFVQSQIDTGVSLGFTKEESRELAKFYGSNISCVYELAKKNRSDAMKYGIPLSLFSKLVYGLECEMVATPLDFFNRRTGDILFDIKLVKQWKKQVITYMADQLGWNGREKQKHSIALENALTTAENPAD
jgi:glycerol-3-phosphate dehydrogenase